MSRLTESARVTDLIKPAENDQWCITRFGVGDGLSALSESFGSLIRTGRGATPSGEYTRLDRKVHYQRRDGSEGVRQNIVMSDTHDEMRDLFPILIHGTGRVLVNGLGLGCVVKGLLAKPEVEHIDVVEISPELISLVGPYYEGDRVTIHQGDAFTFKWPTGTHWDAAWHDVWDDLCGDNLTGDSSYERLHRSYGRRSDWQGSWGFEFLKSRRAAYFG